MTPQTNGPNIDEAFVTDRAVFWGRFTNFVKFGTIAVVCLMIGLLLFVY